MINGDGGCSFWQPVQADSQPKSSGLVLGRRSLGAILHSSDEPGELSQWLCHDNSTINIVVLIIIIITLPHVAFLGARCVQVNKDRHAVSDRKIAPDLQIAAIYSDDLTQITLLPVVGMWSVQKGFTALHVAAKYGHVEATKLLLQDKRTDVNVTGKNALTALHVATHYDNLDVVLLLMEHAANTHAVAKVTRLP